MIGKNLIIIILAFVVVFAAGGVVENVRKRVEKPTNDSWFAHQLNLSQEQSDQIKKIFADARNTGMHFDQRHELQKERDDSVRALIPADRQSQFDQILADYTAKTTAAEQTRRQVMRDAQIKIEQTVLTPEQAAKFEDMLKQRAGDRRWGPSSQPLSALPTTQPAAPAAIPH